MARPFKAGLDYFTVDCFLEDKIKLIEAEFGCKGFAVVVKLWQRIYSDKGYYCEWNKDIALLFATHEVSDCGVNLVNEIVNACIRRSIFSKELFDKYEILTSRGIQKRYFLAVSERKKVELIKEYLLVEPPINSVNPPNNSVNPPNNSVNPPNNSVNPPNNSVNPPNNPQSKVKESKVKESNTICSEQDELAAEPPIITLPLNDKSEHPISQSQIDEWSELFPAVNVLQELKKMKAWCNANPDNRKTKRGINRFIVNWLSKTQDKGGTNNFNAPVGGKGANYSDVNRYSTGGDDKCPT